MAEVNAVGGVGMADPKWTVIGFLLLKGEDWRNSKTASRQDEMTPY
jgi:hypothetical protein